MNRKNRVLPLVVLAVGVITVWLHWPSVHNGFVDWDDYVYLQEAAHHPRLSWSTVEWAFRTTRPFYYHPLARLTHVLDFQLWGWDAAGHHLPNVLLHGLNASLVTALVWWLTGMIPSLGLGARWVMAFGVGLAFGIHPLQVESVAWVAERKTVLCGLFSLSALCLYLRSVASPVDRNQAVADSVRPARIRPARKTMQNRPSPGYWWWAMFSGIAALLSKPMAVSVPIAMLAIDFYPLGRHRPGGWRRLILEKWLLIAAAAGISIATLGPSLQEGGVTGLARLDVATRLLVVARNLAFYVWKVVWPQWLSPYYPLEGTISVAAPEYWMSALILGIVTWLAVWQWRRAPALIAGWAVFLGLLLPVSGLIQTGAQATADRFMYLALIPLLMLLAWAGVWAWKRLRAPGRCAVIALAGFELLFWGITTRGQIGIWRNDVTLWSEALAHFPDSAMANGMMANALTRVEQYDLARPLAEKAIALSPDFFKAHATLGVIDYRTGRYREAAVELATALRYKPDLTPERYRLACAWSLLGRSQEALAALRIALAQDPSFRSLAATERAFESLARDPASAAEFRALLGTGPTPSRSPAAETR